MKSIYSIIKLTLSKRGETDTEGGRSRERFRRIGQTAFSSLLARVINVGTGLITVPLTLSYLGQDRFGLWMVLTGFVAFLTFTDMGLGIGLQNALTECDGKKDLEAPSPLVSTAMFMMFGIFFILCCFSLFILPCIPLEKIIKVASIETQKDLLPTAQAVLLTFAFGLPCGLIQRVLNAYQEGFVANMLLAGGNLLSLIGIYISVWLKAPLYLLVAVYMGMPFIILGLSSIYIFGRKPWLIPRFNNIQLNHLRKISGIGIRALGAQIGATIMVTGPALLLANRFGTTSVVPFSVTQRLLGVAGILLAMALAPLWPAYGEAYACGDRDWIRKTFKNSILFAAVISIPVFFGAIIIGRPLIGLWTGSSESIPDWSLFMACNVWAFIMAWVRICSMFLNGLNQMTGQAIYGIILSIIAIATGFFFAKDTSVAGVIWCVVIVGELPRVVCFGLETFWTLQKKVGMQERGNFEISKKQN